MFFLSNILSKKNLRFLFVFSLFFFQSSFCPQKGRIFFNSKEKKDSNKSFKNYFHKKFKRLLIFSTILGASAFYISLKLIEDLRIENRRLNQVIQNREESIQILTQVIQERNQTILRLGQTQQLFQTTQPLFQTQEEAVRQQSAQEFTDRALRQIPELKNLPNLELFEIVSVNELFCFGKCNLCFEFTNTLKNKDFFIDCNCKFKTCLDCLKKLNKCPLCKKELFVEKIQELNNALTERNKTLEDLKEQAVEALDALEEQLEEQAEALEASKELAFKEAKNALKRRNQPLEEQPLEEQALEDLY